MIAVPYQADARAPRLTFGGVTVECCPSDGAVLIFVDPGMYNVTFRAGRAGGDTGKLHHCIIVSPYLLPSQTESADAPPTSAIMSAPPTAPESTPSSPTVMVESGEGDSRDPDEIGADVDYVLPFAH